MTQDPTRTSSGILIYETSLSFLKDACDELSSPNQSKLGEDMEVRRRIEGYILSMASDDVVGAIIDSLECRQRVLELANQLGLTNDPGLRTALRRDEERMATLLVSIFSSKSDEERVLRLKGNSAQHFLDVVQETLDSGFIVLQEHTRLALRIVRKLSESCDMLPSSLFIVGVEERDEHPSFGGGFGDIYRASYGGQRVALKCMRHFLRGSDLRRIRLRFYREALVWKDLHHPNILPFLGIDRDSFPSALCMVSPWMKHGTVINYLKTHGFANVDKLLYEIAQGLEYLHSHNLVHGDLRGANILIKEDWSACLSDFGLSFFSDATSTTSTNRAGSLYWMAPELLDPDRFNLKFSRTPATDVYAFGCVCVELYTARPPFSGLSETATMLKVLNGGRPERPLGPPAMSDTLWQHVTEFWVESHIARPPTHSVVRNMVWPHPDITPVATDELSSLVIVAEETKFLHDRLSMPFLDRPALRPSPSLPTSGGTRKTNNSTPGLASPSGKGKSWRRRTLNVFINILPSQIAAGRSRIAKCGSVGTVPPNGLTGSVSSLDRNEVKHRKTTTDDGGHVLKARALYAYTASADDPNELSFSKGEILDIEDAHGKWWQATKSDGSLGIAPSNCLVIIPAEDRATTSTRNTSTSSTAEGEPTEDYQYKGKALYRYKAPENDPNELSFDKGEILDVLDKQGKHLRDLRLALRQPLLGGLG